MSVQPNAKKHLLPLLAITVGLFSTPTFAVQNAELLNNNLQMQKIRFVRLAGSRITYFDSERRLRSASLDNFVLIRLEKPQPQDPNKFDPLAPIPPDKPNNKQAKPAEAAQRPPLLDGAPARKQDAKKLDTKIIQRPDGIIIRNKNVVIKAANIEIIPRDAPAKPKPNANNPAINTTKPPPTTSAPPPIGTLRLSNGHIFKGYFAGISKDGNLQWKTPHFGTLSFSLDDISTFDKYPVSISSRRPPKTSKPNAKNPIPELGIAPPQAAQVLRARLLPNDKPAAAKPLKPTTTKKTKPAPKFTPPRINPDDVESDTIILYNGDRLEGFVDAMTAKHLALEVNNQIVKLAWSRVGLVVLANPIKETPGNWVRLRDQSKVKVDELVLDGRLTTGKLLNSKPVQLDTTLIAGVDFAVKHRLIRLNQLQPKIISGGNAFGVPFKPQAKGPHLHIHAPMKLQYRLPTGTLRIAANAYIEPSDLDWADMILNIADGKGPIIKKQLNAETPSLDINLAPRDQTLIIDLDDAVNGPVRDRLQLKNAILLVERQKK